MNYYDKISRFVVMALLYLSLLAKMHKSITDSYHCNSDKIFIYNSNLSCCISFDPESLFGVLRLFQTIILLFNFLLWKTENWVLKKLSYFSDKSQNIFKNSTYKKYFTWTKLLNQTLLNNMNVTNQKLVNK